MTVAGHITPGRNSRPEVAQTTAGERTYWRCAGALIPFTVLSAGDDNGQPGQCSHFVLDGHTKLGYIVSVRFTEGRAHEAS